jgi:2-(1,2-epoxy-1,2-dihydrophenyl)acetyl-CoA isomerase
MSEAIIQSDQQGGVLLITLNRPDVLNSFNGPMARLLHAELDRAGSDASVRCVVLTGAGRAFCAGQDLSEAIDPTGPGITKIVEEHYNPIILGIRKIDKPVIAMVNGVAAGAGANIALACDLVIAAHSASFIQAFSKIGLIPDSAGTFFLPRLIGWQKATALMMTGEKVSAEKAEQMNMIYKAVPDDHLINEVMQLANQLSQMPTRALGYTKRLLEHSFTADLQTQLGHEAAYQEKAASTEDYLEGVEAFIAKRKPNFTGR